MRTFKRTALAATLLASTLASHSAMAEWSANIGVVSDYHFRGIQQTESASTTAATTLRVFHITKPERIFVFKQSAPTSQLSSQNKAPVDNLRLLTLLASMFGHVLLTFLQK